MNTQTAINTLPGFKANLKSVSCQDNVPGIERTFALRPNLARSIGLMSGPRGKRVSQHQIRCHKNRHHT